jgi:hypothetical protein
LFYLCAWLQKYFKRAEGEEIACDVILHELCRVRVTGMHYEARVQCVRDWHAERKVWMSKADCRDTLMAPWQYLQVLASMCYLFPHFHVVYVLIMGLSCVCRTLLSTSGKTGRAFLRWSYGGHPASTPGSTRRASRSVQRWEVDHMSWAARTWPLPCRMR